MSQLMNKRIRDIKRNVEIAKILGFKFKTGKMRSGQEYRQVIYPDEFSDMIRVSPETEPPDFVRMIKFYMDLKREVGYGAPRDYGDWTKLENLNERD